MNWEALGAIAETLGATGVIATLAYLAVQIRQNTRSLDEGQRLAKVQSYEKRADMVAQHLVALRDSPSIAKIAPGDGQNLDTEEDHARFVIHMRWWMNFCDNLHYQYKNGYLDGEYYEYQFHVIVQSFAPRWRELGIVESRPSFSAEVDRILTLLKDTNPGDGQGLQNSD